MNLPLPKRTSDRVLREQEIQREIHDEQIRTAMSLRSYLAAGGLCLHYIDIPKKWPFGRKGLAKAWILPPEGDLDGKSYAVTVDGRGGWTKPIKGEAPLLIGNRFLGVPEPLSDVLDNQINSTGMTVGELILASIGAGFQEVNDYPAMEPTMDQTPQLAVA